MKILALETSNNTMSIALIENDSVIGEINTTVKKNHSERLMPAIEFLLKDCKVTLKEIDKIAVSKGPGSYTGVRIAVTIAKTLAYSLNIPIVGFSSLETLSYNIKNENTLICPIFDARRNQVFTGLYRFVDGNIINVLEDRLILIDDWLEILKDYENISFIGLDTINFKEVIINTLGDSAAFYDSAMNYPKAVNIALASLKKDGEDVHSFTPEYLKLAEAEEKWLETNKGKESVKNAL